MHNNDFLYQNVQQYLDVLGVLEHGDETAIAEARKTFRKLYLKQYQKAYLKKHSNITLWLDKEDKKLLKDFAIANGKRLAVFIKEVALEKANNTELNSYRQERKLLEMEELFSLCFDIVEELQYEHPELKTAFEELNTLFQKIELHFKS